MKTSMLVTRRKVAFGIAASSFFISDRAVLAAAIAAIKALKPGEFIWRPEVSPAGSGGHHRIPGIWPLRSPV
jgi:hypothetical protein